uniref:Transcription factor n=1 Tax=Rhizophora mucronata TaxID=61149 RepID=A0A2P2LWG5_RHIMU
MIRLLLFFIFFKYILLRFTYQIFCSNYSLPLWQIPDELVEHYLARSGFQCPDVRLIRLVAVATQKFVAEGAKGVWLGFPQ